MQVYFILSLIASIALIIFAITNATAVPVKIFFVKYELSLALVIFMSTAVGAIIATLIGLPKQFKLNRQIKKLNSENQKLMAENKDLQEKDFPTQESQLEQNVLQEDEMLTDYENAKDEQ